MFPHWVCPGFLCINYSVNQHALIAPCAGPGVLTGVEPQSPSIKESHSCEESGTQISLEGVQEVCESWEQPPIPLPLGTAAASVLAEEGDLVTELTLPLDASLTFPPPGWQSLRSR